jgi:hypothetical protein
MGETDPVTFVREAGLSDAKVEMILGNGERLLEELTGDG